MARSDIDAVQRRRGYEGPAFLSYGFRPFFFLGSVHAGLSILVWLPVFYSQFTLSSAMAPLEWHIHEMLYGFLPAAVAGFLLTAVPNWTGRYPVSGWPLGGLTLLWLLGRVAMLFSAFTGLTIAAFIDAAFLVCLAAVITREIVAGKSYKNLRVLGGVALLACGNVVFLAEAAIKGYADYGIRIGIAAGLALVMVIGGRIIPSFTRNWLVRENPGRLPMPFNRFDVVAIIASLVALLTWVALPAAMVTGALFVLAGILQLVRLMRWAGDRTVRDRLVLILHVGYLFVPLGFLFGSLGIFGLVLPSAGVHAWTSGAFALTILAVMSRASLGHTGRALVASPAVQVIYLFAVVAAVTRIIAAVQGNEPILLMLSAMCWVAAFLGFAAVYAPILLLPRRA